MPDPTPQPPYSWPQFARDALQVIQWGIVLYLAHLGNSNHDAIERKGTEIVQKQEEQTTRVDTVKADLDRKQAADKRALEVNLRSSWKYLESLAVESGKQSDKDNAATAKKVLDDFLAQKNGH